MKITKSQYLQQLWQTHLNRWDLLKRYCFNFQKGDFFQSCRNDNGCVYFKSELTH